MPGGMHLSEGFGKIAVDAHDEGDTGDACDRGADAAGVAEGDQECGDHAEQADFQYFRANR